MGEPSQVQMMPRSELEAEFDRLVVELEALRKERDDMSEGPIYSEEL